MEDIIRIDHLSKNFGSIKAVQDLSFRVKQGELFAFLGVNGAGKSTTINILCGQLQKDSGSVLIDSRDLDQETNFIKRELGVVFQSSVLDSALSVYDNLESRAALYGITGKEFRQRLSELAKILDFESLLKRTTGKLSGGQRRRIDIARALFHNPKILILDDMGAGFNNFHIRFLMELCIILGFSPDSHGLAPFAGDRMETMDRFLKASFEEAMMIPLTGAVRNEIAEDLLRYIEFHSESSVNVKSLQVLRELFR